jgi:membrane protein implicated in regulation of membrane protease activity
MMHFFETMDGMQKLFWFIAIPASVIFLIQSIMTFIGLDAADGVDADFDGDILDGDAPFQLFSFRNLINFLLGFGWSGITFYDTIPNATLLTLIAFLIGAGFVALFFWMMRKVQSLAEDNTFKLADTLQLIGEVYIPIPGDKRGKGKIQVSVKGAAHELDAITEGSQKIETGSMIRVVSVENNILIVEKI